MTRVVDLKDAPLRAAIALIQEELQLPVVCDVQALTDDGIDIDAFTVTRKLEGVSVTAALRSLLRDAGLTWTIRDETLTVTTRNKAREELMVVAYPPPRAYGDTSPADIHSLIDMLQSVVAPETWDAVGGPAAVRPLELAGDPLLVIAQTGEGHDEVEALLRRVHERHLAEFAGGNPVLRVHRIADRAAAEGLRDTVKDLCNGSLGERGDAEARVAVVGDSVTVLSKSPEFHSLAAQMVAAVGGVTVRPAVVLPRGAAGGSLCGGR